MIPGVFEEQEFKKYYRYFIGKRFAYLEMKTAFAHLILKYDFQPCPETEIPLQYVPGFFLLKTKTGLKVNISKRK